MVVIFPVFLNTILHIQNDKGLRGVRLKASQAKTFLFYYISQ